MAGQADDRGRRDLHTGELALFDRDSGVDLVDAVTVGTALPGSSPTVNINGTHYINGGVRSAENADLAWGYANVVVLSPFGGRSGTLPEGQFEGLRRPPEWGMDLEGQVEALRKQGSHVQVITPDPPCTIRNGHEPDGRRPASPPPVPVSSKASRKRPVRRSSDRSMPPPKRRGHP